MAEHNDLGDKGEGIAVSYLKNKGYAILETNWRYGQLEVDIIAQKGDELIIAEVKTRRSNYFGEPESFVSKQKQQNLIKAAHHYITTKQLNVEVRFDIIAVVYNDVKQQINHLEAAYYPRV